MSERNPRGAHGPGGSSATPLVCARGIARNYPGVRALRDLDLDLYAGEVVAICGANGAGKSTFARLLAGQEPPSDGRICVADGEPIASRRAAFDAGVLMLHQEPLIIDDFTVGENVWLYALREGGASAWERGRETDDADTRAALDAVGLTGMPTRRLASTLTPGQRQMLALTRAVVNPHRVLILDETTASTTEAYFELVKGVVAREKAAGVCVLFVSHRLQEVFDIADRIVVLRNGALIRTLQASQTDAAAVTSLMIGDALKVLHRPRTDATAEVEPVMQVDGLYAGSARNVSFNVRSGEIVGLYGLVGSGRSSIGRAITGRARALSGSIRIHGRHPNLNTPETALREKIAYVSEDRRRDGFVPDFTNGENLTLVTLAKFSAAGVLDLARERLAAEDLARQFTVKGATSALTSTLSGGNQQKVCIAKWVAVDPDVIVFDEPTKGIDVGARATIYEIIYDMAAAGKTIVVISSEAEEILLLTHRVFVMREGAVVAELDSREADTEELGRFALGAQAA